MAVGPGVADVAGVVVCGEAAIDDPAERVGSTVAGDVWEFGERVGGAMDRVVEVEGDGLDARQDLVHHGDEFIAPAGAAAVVAEEHAVLFGEVVAQSLDIGRAHLNAALAGHVHQRRALRAGKFLRWRFRWAPAGR